MDVTLTSVGYFYMIGDFDAAIKEAYEALTNQKLKPKYRDFQRVTSFARLFLHIMS